MRERATVLLALAAALASLAAAPSAPPPAASPAPAAAPDAGEVPEARPEHLGTPATSAAALPAWQPRPQRQLLRGQVPYAPQSPDADLLFDRAPAQAAKVGPIRDAALACTVDFGEREFDELLPFANRKMVFGDLCAIAGVPAKGKPLTSVTVAFGPGDANLATFLVPLASLDPGQELSLRLLDIDAAFDDPIDTVRAVYRGTMPLPLARQGMKGECRLVGREALEAVLPEHLRKTDEELAQARKDFRADLFVPRTRDVDASLRAPRLALADGAALVGWDDPRVKARVERIAGLEKEFAAEWEKAFAAAREKVAPAGEWTPIADGRLELRVAALRCGPALSAYSGLPGMPSMRAPDACALELDVRNRTDRAMKLGSVGMLEPIEQLQLFDRRGSSRDVLFAAQLRGGRGTSVAFGGTLEAGKEARYVVFPELEGGVLRQGRLPLLLRGRPAFHLSDRKPASLTVWSGAAGVEVVDYSCADASFVRAAEAANVWPSRGPFCGLRLRLENRGAVPLSLEPLAARSTALVDAAGASVDCRGIAAVGGPAPRPAGRLEPLAPGGKIELLLLFDQAGAPADLDEARLRLPRAGEYFFVPVVAP